MPFAIRIKNGEKTIVGYFSEKEKPIELFSDACNNLCATQDEQMFSAKFQNGEISVEQYTWRGDKFFPHDFKILKK